MSERYSKLFTLSENLYAMGSPVVIAAGALLKDNQTGRIVAQLKLRSISPKVIIGVKVQFCLFDNAGNPIGTPMAFDYLDLSASRDAEFGQKTPIPVAENKARSYSVTVQEVVYADKCTWMASDTPWESLPRQKTLDAKLHDPELVKQYGITVGSHLSFYPLAEKDIWYCACGALNHEGESCHICHRSLFELQAIDLEQLAKDRNTRLAQEADAAAAKAAAEKAAMEAAKMKTAKVLKIVIPIVCTVIAFVIFLNSVIIPNSKYDKAISLMEAGEYEAAIAEFEAMDGYKDSIKQIENCETAIVAAEQARIEEEMAEKFEYAEELLAAGDYDAAIAIFESLTNYDGSSEGIAAAKEGKMDAAYRAAEALEKNGETARAAIAFGKLRGYKDARERSFVLWDEVAVRETLSAGQAHTVAIKTDGTVIATGSNSEGQCNVSDWQNIIAISAGRGHTAGLKSDGTVVAVGYDEGGRLDVDGWTDIVAISARGTHTVGLKCDGTVVVVGYNGDGRCDVEEWENIIAIDAGTYHTVGLKSDGTVLAVGSNKYHQCEVESWSNIVAISGGESHTIGLRSDGTVVATKKPHGYGDSEYRDTGDWSNIYNVCAGSGISFGVQKDGHVLYADSSKELFNGTNKWNNIVAISVNYVHIVGLKSDGTVVAEGKADKGRCDVSAWKDIKLPN